METPGKERSVMKRMNMWFAVLVAFGALAFASPVHAQAPAPGPKVTVVNPESEPVPVKVVGTSIVDANVSGAVSIVGTPTVNANVSGEVSIAGTPTVNANVSGEVGIAGTPTVDVRSMPGVRPGFYLAQCSAAGVFCQSDETKEAAPGTAFRIDAIQARNFGSGSDVTGTLSLGITTPGLGAPFEVPCINVVGFASCNATPGIHVTSLGGVTFQLSSLAAGGTTARVIVYYTVVPLAP
jgi:hypothetical protein